MGLADDFRKRASSAVGGALAYVGTLASESIEHAGEQMVKARGTSGTGGGGEVAASPKSLMYDPFAVIDQLGYKDKASGISYGTIAAMFKRVPICGAIRQTRINQVASFSIPQENDREPGFQLMQRDRRGKATRASKKRAAELERWLLNTGHTESFEKDTFEVFIRKTIHDSMTFDQMTFETVDDRKGDPYDFYAIDAATIRIADAPLGVDPSADEDHVRYVQVYDETVIAEFSSKELCFGVRNPRTGIRLNGYGESEMEMMLSTVTALLYGFEWNKRAFSQGSAARGILNFKGAIPDQKLDAFRRHWYQMLSGVQNAWRTPITNADELQWISMHSSNRDMEFAEWINFLIRLTTGMFQMDASELGFTFGNVGQTSTLFQGGPAERIKASKDRGLRPILRSLQHWLNKHLIWRIDEDFQLQFTGIDARSEDQLLDQQKKQVSYLKTVDEIRAEEDLQPLPDGKGEVILDPTWLQFSQAADMAGQQMGGFEGEQPPGQPGEQEEEPAEMGDLRSLFAGTEQEEEPAEAVGKSLRKARVAQMRDGNNRTIYEIEI